MLKAATVILCLSGPCHTFSQDGVASWYGPGFYNQVMANGEIYKKNHMTAASKTIPLGRIVEVTNLENGLSVVVRITDRGPFIKGRILDLSEQAAKRLHMVNDGLIKVRIVG